jgi:YfiH family protein
MMSRTVAAQPDESLAAQFAAAGLDWIVPAWVAPREVHAFFTTRDNARSANASPSRPQLGERPDSSDGTRRSMDALASRAKPFLPAPVLWLDQVHGSSVLDIDSATLDGGELPRADAAVTRKTDRVLAVRVADCLPVLLTDCDGSVVAIAHAGWRGLAAGILENTVAAMSCDPTRVVAWLGPAIGRTAFEVGDEVRAAFVTTDAAATQAFVAGQPGKWHADLVALARQRLARAGVSDVIADGGCTASEPGRFLSFRRDRTTERMAAFIWRSPG